MNAILKIRRLLTKKERRQATLLFCMVLAMALLDVVGVASIMPFMAVLADPQIIERNALLKYTYDYFEFSSSESFLFFLGASLFIFYFLSLSFKMLTTYVQLRFVLILEFNLGRRLIEGYLHQPYEWFLNRHSAELGKTILSEVGTVINQGLMQLVVLIAQSTVVVCLLLLLIFVYPSLALTIGTVLGLLYGITFLFFSSFLSKIGQERFQANQELFASVGEAFGAIKEVKIGNLEQRYIRRFAKPARSFALNMASAAAIAQLPRYMFEAVAFGGMLLVVLYLLAMEGDIATILPVIALYALAGYRLMPALQQVYASSSQLRFVGPAIESLVVDLDSLTSRNTFHNAMDELPFRKAIAIDKLTYGYPGTSSPTIKGVSLRIPARRSTAFVGSTGSGKTTLIDLILGLLEPSDGTISIDGTTIDASNLNKWQAKLGYVPQNIYLTDDSVAANIAFGVEPEDHDTTAIERAARAASLHDFIVSDLPDGYLTTVGERGVRLSGGQRQRLGIARALYRQPEVLIFDEATSALDNTTEFAVMDAIRSIEGTITVILIAHRLSSVRHCEQIYFLEKGEIIARGTYDILMKKSESFREMVNCEKI